MKMKLI